MTQGVRPGGKPNDTRKPDSSKGQPPSSRGLAAHKESIEHGERHSTGWGNWIKDCFLSLCAFFKGLFTSSEEPAHREEEEEKISIIRTSKTEQEHVDAIRASVLDDFTTAASHFKQMTHPKAQLQLIKELMKDKRTTPGVINGLMNLYKDKQTIYNRMKEQLIKHDLSFLIESTTVSKETYLAMSNEGLFRKFPKSDLAQITISALIEKMRE